MEYARILSIPWRSYANTVSVSLKRPWLLNKTAKVLQTSCKYFVKPYPSLLPGANVASAIVVVTAASIQTVKFHLTTKKDYTSIK